MSELDKHTLASKIADELIYYLDEWYSLPEQFDNELDRQIHEWYANAPNVFPKRPYFSPSSSGDDPRAMYYKSKYGNRVKDRKRKQPHTGRWTQIGTAVGDAIQRSILAMERSKDINAPFRFERNEDGTPMFEDFAKRNVKVTHKGKTFYLFGTCDGILEYIDRDTGEKLRVGLEIKSKQTTPARTSDYSMREPESKHVDQCTVYGHMYDVDLYVVLYVNLAKKGWFMSEEDYAKTPDIRAFGIVLDDYELKRIFDKFAGILSHVEANKPPKLDVGNWTFNNFKEICVSELTEEEYADILEKKKAALKSNLKDYQKKKIVQAVEEIEALRNGKG